MDLINMTHTMDLATQTGPWVKDSWSAALSQRIYAKELATIKQPISGARHLDQGLMLGHGNLGSLCEPPQTRICRHCKQKQYMATQQNVVRLPRDFIQEPPYHRPSS